MNALYGTTVYAPYRGQGLGNTGDICAVHGRTNSDSDIVFDVDALRRTDIASSIYTYPDHKSCFQIFNSMTYDEATGAASQTRLCSSNSPGIAARVHLQCANDKAPYSNQTCCSEFSKSLMCKGANPRDLYRSYDYWVVSGV